jgi:ABC-type multidrug transport system fused ATPase/permease subunit
MPQSQSQPPVPWWKHILFSEARPLVEAGRHHILSENDIMEMPETQVPNNVDQHEAALDFSTGSKLIWSNLRALGGKYRLAVGYFLVAVVLGMAMPVLVNHFIKLLSHIDGDQAVGNLLILGLIMGGTVLAQGILYQHHFYHVLGCEQISTRALNKKIFLHSLRLSVDSRNQTPVGDIVNHMSTDSDGVCEFVFIFSEALETLFTTIGTSALLFYYLGWTALAPLALFFILVPITKKLAGRFTHLDDEMMKWRDRRVSLMTQILSAIRLVKYFVWEKSVYEEVQDAREKELAARKKMAQTEVMSNAAYTSVSSIVLFVALGVHALRGQNIDLALIFTCISLFGLLESPLGHMSNLLSRFTNSFVGSQRLVRFLEKSEKIPSRHLATLSQDPVGVSAGNLTIKYGEGKSVLRGVNFVLQPGKSLAIVGPVGAGKTSLLLALLGELTPKVGNVSIWSPLSAEIGARQAFCPQEAYIINGSLAENLSFGETVTEADFQRALRITALEQDMKLFPAGLNTEIGEKGVNLSGGQKQRVALARAILSQPGLVFLDDPLSAVDVETEKHLVENLLFGEWKNITRILTTHRMECLEQFDQILFLDQGEVAAMGDFKEIMQNPRFAEFYSAHHDIHKAESSIAATVTHQVALETHSRITDDEERERGAVKSTVYKDYILSLGGEGPFRKINLFLLFAGTTTAVLMPLLQKAWLSKISDFGTPLHGVMIYGLLGLATLAIGLMNGLFWLKRGVESGRNMHNAMLKAILAAPIRFFDSTPMGRIIQRFSRDIESVDVYLQWTFDSAVHCFLQIIVTLSLIIFVLPITLIVMGPILIFYYFLQRDYRRPAREIKRLDSLARSPRYAHFKETLMGLTVIRGFRKEDWFIENFKRRLFYSQQTFYNHYILNRWFSVRVPILGGAIAGTTALFLTLAVQKGYIQPGIGGLLLIYSLSFWGFLNWGVRVFSDIESRMTSIERLKFYSNIASEKGHTLEVPRDQLWPRRGEIEFRSVSVRYAAHLPMVLKDVSFSVQHGERIGLIGRTGSGKSTLLQTLFRFVDIESGQIFVDGREIRDVSLPELRGNLAIIPQDPVLFMGTIRSNLDRYNQYLDIDIEKSLVAASMWDFISLLPLGLETMVTENGSNFSQGQRQLLCMARALLVKAKVIVLDEATASVDVQTDLIIQKVIRQSLKDVTLLIIAHRLGTVMDSDRIIELSQGQVKDIWSPADRRIDAAEFDLES